ncbi:myocardin isoform X3 [Pleurodeles waltl]|uniref:myocardin isoform X3 n=1 Tax=Pleurodeles waltl TaxID=8319 RepID=UPI0037095F63
MTMTLLGSEHSLLIRNKFRSALKSPAAFHEQRKSLERAKTEDYLKHKMRNRPERSDLVNMHILEDSSADGSLQATQMKLKRARLADDLNERIALRPGPLELVEKNILPVDSTVKEAMKAELGTGLLLGNIDKRNHVNFSKSEDAFAFDEDSSDGLSPEQPRSDDSQGSSAGSPPEVKSSETATASTPAALEDPSPGSENGVCDQGSEQSSESPNHNSEQMSPAIPVPAAIKSKLPCDKNRHKKPKDTKPKVKKLKYHQYIPPDQKAEKSPPPMDSAYARLLQQQQLFLQLQILSQQQHHHFNYQGLHQPQLKQPSGEHMVRSSNSSTGSSPCLSPVKTTFSGQSSASAVKPGPLPSNLDDLKVSELRQQLRIRGLPVSGTKTALMERLRPFQDCGGSTAQTFNDITTVTFPVTPNNSLTNYQSHPSPSVLSNGFYQFGSTSSTPPISPASSDLSVGGSLPDTFNDRPMSSPQYGLQPSPAHLSAEESLMSSMNGGSFQCDLEVMDAEKDKMLVEKQKVINELTWKLQQEQRQVEELKLQLQKRKKTSASQENHIMSQQFFGVPIKQENPVSSCPFASKQMSIKAQPSSSPDTMRSCDTHQMSHILNSHCMDSSGQNAISSTFLSPQCSPQHSPLGTVHSPQHISLPPSPNSHYLLPVSPVSQADGRSVSPQGSSRLRGVQSTISQTGSPNCFSQNASNMQATFMSNQSESKQVNHDCSSPKSPSLNHKMAVTTTTAQASQKFPSPTFCNSNSVVAKTKQPPSYEDAVKQQITRSQQMDELLDVLIESGEMPAHAKDERSCGQKVPQITVSSSGSTTVSLPKPATPFEHISPALLPFDHCTNNNGSHLEVLLNTHSPNRRASAIPILKLGAEDSHFEGMIEGFSGKTSEEVLSSREILDTSLPPIPAQMSPTISEGSVLQHLSFTESPWESMEWLDLTPPSSATGFVSLTTTGPSIFNTDFLDVSDLNLNTAMDLHLEQW